MLRFAATAVIEARNFTLPECRNLRLVRSPAPSTSLSGRTTQPAYSRLRLLPRVYSDPAQNQATQDFPKHRVSSQHILLERQHLHRRHGNLVWVMRLHPHINLAG